MQVGIEWEMLRAEDKDEFSRFLRACFEAI
jgi:hypothetical protein